MASVNQLLIEALEAFGAPGSPSPDPTSEMGVRIRRQLIRTLRVRIPQFVPGLTRDGIVTKAIAPSTTPAEDVTGIYAWPSDLASALEPLILSDAAGADYRPTWYSNPKTFWDHYELSDLTQGTPSGVLVRGRTFRLRPIPQASLGPFVLTIHGTLYPAAPASDETDSIALDLEDAVVSGAVLFTAMREGHEDVQARFLPLWESSLKQLTGIDLTTHKATHTVADF